MKQFLYAYFTLLTLLAPAALPSSDRNTPPPGAENGYVTRTYTDADGRSMTYYLHVPDEQDQRWYPLVLLLHGGGQRGQSANSPDQNRSIMLDDPYVTQWTTAQVQGRWPCFVVVPQLMDSQSWVDVPSAQGSYHQAAQPTSALLLAKEIVDALQQTYSDIDAGRLYITGISIGGYGVWDAIERWPNTFAAAAPVSGGGDPTGASRLTHLPIWVFQGEDDGDPSVSASRAMVQAIRAAGGHPRYTVVPQAGHDIWLQVYTSPAFLAWLFAQKSLPGSTIFGIHSVTTVFQYLGAFLQRNWFPLVICGLLLGLFFHLRSGRKPYKP